MQAAVSVELFFQDADPVTSSTYGIQLSQGEDRSVSRDLPHSQQDFVRIMQDEFFKFNCIFVGFEAYACIIISEVSAVLGSTPRSA